MNRGKLRYFYARTVPDTIWYEPRLEWPDGSTYDSGQLVHKAGHVDFLVKKTLNEYKYIQEEEATYSAT